jgi:hypothetical protein
VVFDVAITRPVATADAFAWPVQVELLEHLEALETVVVFNAASLVFKIMAKVITDEERVARLALKTIDIMLMFVARKG